MQECLHVFLFIYTDICVYELCILFIYIVYLYPGINKSCWRVWYIDWWIIIIIIIWGVSQADTRRDHPPGNHLPLHTHTTVYTVVWIFILGIYCILYIYISMREKCFLCILLRNFHTWDIYNFISMKKNVAHHTSLLLIYTYISILILGIYRIYYKYQY